VANAVRRHLEHIFKKSNPPTYQGGDNPWFRRKILQMAIPGEGHKNITAGKQNNGQVNILHFIYPGILKPQSNKNNTFFILSA
jgi:hypothetical protein